MASIWLLSTILLAGSTTSPNLRVNVAWSDAQSLVPYGDMVRREVASILRASGVAVAWAEHVPASHEAPGDRATVVFTSSSPSGAGWTLPSSAMGAYLNAGSSSAIFVFHQRVAHAVGLPEASERLLTPLESRTMARALARVIVHELVHRISPEQPHAASGVMQAHLDRHALTRPRLALDTESGQALAAALRLTSSQDAPVRR